MLVVQLVWTGASLVDCAFADSRCVQVSILQLRALQSGLKLLQVLQYGDRQAIRCEKDPNELQRKVWTSCTQRGGRSPPDGRPQSAKNCAALF